ncbi:MAG: hypothetical protein QOD00_323, partial [Blastocatellia bacterium]|nr:hypothetical protein [Blastocatellia bacterium]
MSSKSVTQADVFPDSLPRPSTLVELLRWRAARQADRVAYTFLVDGEAQEAKLTYGELDQQARAIGAALQAVLTRGDRVLLIYPPGLEYIAAFFGCLYAGAIAVPAYPPRFNRNLLRLQSLVADAGAVVGMTTAPLLSRMSNFFNENPELEALRWLTSESVTTGIAERWQEPALSDKDIAFLQYTSGST